MKLILALSIALLAACTMGPSKGDRDPASVIKMESGTYRAKELTNETILAYSSSKNLEMQELKVITDNTDALNSKLAIVESAKKELLLMYYIYGFDESSSYLTSKILEKAKKGLQVKILVDFFVNYKNYDYFKMLEAKSNGNIQVGFYGVPAEALLKTISYVATDCKDQNKACIEKKWSEINAEYAQSGAPFFTRLAMTGIYGKVPNAAKIGLATGSQLDLGGSNKLSEQEKKQLEEFIKLVFRAKIKGDVGAKLKLGMALTFYGKETLPVYEKLLAALPLAGGPKDLSNYWNNATDFIHHKLIIADGKYMQLGGRNIEDSYHMPLSPSGKYTFLDTDVYAELKYGGDEIVTAYKKMWDFKDSVKVLSKLDGVVAHDYLAVENLPALMGAIGQCQAQKETPNYASCVEATAGKQLAILMPARIARAEAKFNSAAAEYAKKGIQHVSTAIAMNDSNTFITYLENLSFTKASNKRLFGAGGDKNITELWIKSIKNTCHKAIQTKQPQQITLLNAYVFLPAAVYMTIGDALNGRMNCPNTTITIATNSIESTDLAPINIFATYQLMLLAKEVGRKSSTQLKILELKKVSHPSNPAATYSLHTKASIFGDDLIIGSANADIRSYHMDSNNAFFIRNAPELAKNYKNWVANFINPANGKFIDKTAYYTALSFKDAQNINSQTFEYMIQKYQTKMSPSTKAKLKALYTDTCTDIYEDSKYFLSTAIRQLDDREFNMRVMPRVKEFDSKYQVF